MLLESCGKPSGLPAFVMVIESFSLVGRLVVLDPMSLADTPELASAGASPAVWEFAPRSVSNEAEMEAYVTNALEERDRGVALPFVTKLADSGRIVGSTRFGNIDLDNRKVEIGWTWISPEWQRSFVNSEAKFLMLEHAFERWKCIRVEFKTDATNLRSRNAILRLGAIEEGTFRQHMITDKGRFRDTVYFSILDKEWPAVREALLEKLSKYR